MTSKVAVIIGAIAACVTLSASLPAQANWQWTHWGMTPQQVVKASHGKAAQATDVERQGVRTASDVALLAMPYRSGTFTFAAYFLFDQEQHLSRVVLIHMGDSAAEIAASLMAKYGKPSDADNSDFGEYTWYTKSEQIFYQGVGPKECAVYYAPRTGGANAGGL
jgi:hypothetical protein